MSQQESCFSSPLVGPGELVAMQDSPELVILDGTIPKVGEKGVHRLADTCISGARYFDLNGKFSDPNTDLPHNLPSESQFTEECQLLGINRDSQIVIYDHHGIYVSPRIWWMFRAMGHINVAVLDGGLPGWIEAGYPTVAKSSESLPQGTFEAKLQPELVWDASRVQAHLAEQDSTAAVIDARSNARFTGAQPEPRAGLKRGHIPGSLNLPFDSLIHSGKMRPKEELAAAFNQLDIGDNELVFTCGSGVTACVTMLAAELVTQNRKAVYDGSWAEWGLETKDFPVQAGEG